MALHNLARMTSATTGTGTLTLGSAVSGFLSFDDAGVVTGETVTYSIRDGANSEIGRGVYTTSGTTLTRATIYESTNGGSAISCSGSQEVFITVAAENTGWLQQINESGSSFTNWTAFNGTWSSAGGVIKQTNTAATFYTAYFTTQQPIAPAFAFEADCKAVSTGAGATHVVGIVVGYGGTNSSGGASFDLRLTAGQRKSDFQRAFTNDLLLLTYAWNDDTFYKLRVVCSGGFATGYIDGTLNGTAGQYPGGAVDARFVGLYTYGCEGHFQNIKGWSLPQPF